MTQDIEIQYTTAKWTSVTVTISYSWNCKLLPMSCLQVWTIKRCQYRLFCSELKTVFLSKGPLKRLQPCCHVKFNIQCDKIISTKILHHFFYSPFVFSFSFIKWITTKWYISAKTQSHNNATHFLKLLAAENTSIYTRIPSCMLKSFLPNLAGNFWL